MQKIKNEHFQSHSNDDWYLLTVNQTLEKTSSAMTGLTEEEAEKRLVFYGPNTLPKESLPSFARVFFRQLLNPLIYILIAAGVISILGGHYADANFIAAVIAVNSIIGSIQEWKASRSSASLQKMLEHNALVVRNNQTYDIKAEQIVPGDIVVLESGQHIPADLRLIEATAVEVDESHLTGESRAVRKNTAPLHKPNLPTSDQCNMVFAGSILIRGRLTGVVTKTGIRTAIGKLAKAIIEHKAGLPPLIIRMKAFTRTITYTTLVVSAILILIGKHTLGLPLSELLTLAIALCVSAIPEGLPVAMTVALSVASARMSKRNVIVRRLAAVESLGSCDYIASDKTGTLTCNQLTATHLILKGGRQFDISGEGYIPDGQVTTAGNRATAASDEDILMRVARAASCANEGSIHQQDHKWAWRGDPVDIAMLVLARKLRYSREFWSEKLPRIHSIPYEPEKGYAASFHNWEESVNDGKLIALVKGAPETVWQMCQLSHNEQQEANSNLEDLASKAFRVIAVADGFIDRSQLANDAMQLKDLNYLGLVALSDPPRAGVSKAIKECHMSGIKVVMLTGDHQTTAYAIAKQLGISSSERTVTSGKKMEGENEESLRNIIPSTEVFARVTPEQKLEIVKAAQDQGHFVAVTGDGVNDAPALRIANVGVAMGQSGTDVARDAADLVLKDDHFASIVAGIQEGRIAYDNIRKVICLLISTGLAEIILVSTALLSGLPLPLLPAQLLWLNLVTNGIQDVALAFEPGEPNIIKRPPRPVSEAIFNRLMIERVVSSSLTIGLISFAAFDHWLASGYSEKEARNLTLLLMVFFEIVHIGNCRSETISTFRISPLKSPMLLFGSIVALAVHLVAAYIPILNEVLDVTPIDCARLAEIFALSLSILFVGEIHKIIWKIRQKRI